MARANNNSQIITCIILFVICRVASAAMPNEEAIFIFGDSTVDVGTNNYLKGTTALANFSYNGIDFPHSVPTGRFSNGYNLADQLAMELGYEMSPKPYLELIRCPKFSEEIQRGVNFASGGSGILDKTGSKLWNRTVSLREQIKQFGDVFANIKVVKGPKEAANLISKSLYIFSVGSNDILDPFRLGFNLSNEFLVTLQSAYRQHLKILYDMGARKFGIIGVAPIGCCPFGRALNKSEGGDGGCMREPNRLALAFNQAVKIMLTDLISQLAQFKYSFADSYKMTKFLMKNSFAFGFTEIKKACCGRGYENAEGFCVEEKQANLCENRGKYVFWDLYHPSQAATNLSAYVIYYGSNLGFVKPVTFQQLAELPV